MSLCSVRHQSRLNQVALSLLIVLLACATMFGQQNAPDAADKPAATKKVAASVLGETLAVQEDAIA